MNRLEVTLQDILWMLKKQIIWILLATILCGVGMWAYTTRFVTPLYTARVSLFVVSNERTGEATNNEQLADLRMANTYVNLLSSNNVLEKVEQVLESNGSVKNISAGVLRSMITAQMQSATQIVNVSIVSADPQLAADVGNAIIDVAPQAIQKIVGAGVMTEIDRAKVPGAPSSPNVRSNTVTGMIVGLLLSVAVVILLAVLDNTVWREDDLESVFEIPVLGSIPNIAIETANQAAKKSRGGY
ncbi:MAG: hypothetical protein LBM28_03795 [Oscillospiraceae bacterium]|jgi:capsular polysaccharide biosynthesis protein|nr:hypothetical protein [Oscillospiraceae bacterium]